MFCPVCKAGYRPGTYRCSRCNVLLVESLPDLPEQKRGAAPGEDSLVLLWEGQDPVLFTAILNALREEEIPLHEAPSFDRPLGHLSLFPSSHDATPSFEIRVFGAHLEKARRVLGAVLEQGYTWERADLPERPAEASPEETSAFPGGAKPEEATDRIWSGENEAIAAFLMDIFRENRLPARLEEDPGGSFHILVRPADEQRAQDILRQVREGKPPA